MYRVCTFCTEPVHFVRGSWSLATKHRPSASLPRRADLRCESNLPRRCRSTFARRRSPEETSRSQRCNIRMHVDPDSSDEEEIATRAALTAAGAILLQAQTDAKSSRSTNRECCSLYSAAKHLEHLRTPWAVPSVYRPSSRPTCSRFGWTGPVALLVLWPTCPRSIAYGIVECR